VWVLRLGEQAERYIHIHPGRYSPHTVRVKASALKTTIAASVWMKILNQAKLTVELLNYVRKEILGTSPVKSLEATEGFVKLFKLVHLRGKINNLVLYSIVMSDRPIWYFEGTNPAII
jgi:hypothetical protein